MKKSRTTYLIFIAIILLGLVVAEYYPAIKQLLKKQITISGLTITRPEGFQIVGDRTILSPHEPLSIHFGQMKNGKESLESYKRYMEEKGVTSHYDSIKVGCKTGIQLRTIKTDDKNPIEDIKIFIEPDLTIFVSMPFDEESQNRELFLRNFLQQNVVCTDNSR